MQWASNYNPMDKIMDDIYLGNIHAASDAKTLNKYGITHILRVLKGNHGTVHPDKFTYKVIQVDDLPNQNLQKYFESAHEFLNDALSANKDGQIKNKVLIHWMVGMSRSATILISYLMMRYPELSLLKAVKFVKGKRPIVSPNEGFWKQLKMYEKVLKKQRAYKNKAGAVHNPHIKSNYQENSPNKNVNVLDPNSRIMGSQTYSQKQPQYSANIANSKARESRNYHYTAGAASIGSLGFIGSTATNALKAQSNEEQKHISHKPYQYNDKHYGNSFLEQNLRLHRNSVLQKSGIDLSKKQDFNKNRPSHAAGSNINNYGFLKKQQHLYSSPVPTTKQPLLPQSQHGYPYINIPPYVQYMSPQRSMNKAQNLVHPDEKSYGHVLAPKYK